nr:reverse transcriptase domain-containing protein [Tanacetum cinerariifolium]
MDKVRRDKRKEVRARLDFEEGSRERRTREDSHHSSARARTTRPERLKVRDRLRYGDRHVLDRIGHRGLSAFDRLSETYSPSNTKSRPGRTNSRDHPRGRSRPRRLDASNEGCPEDRERFCSVGESYDDSYAHSYHDRDRSLHMKRRRDNESPFPAYQKVTPVMKCTGSQSREGTNLRMRNRGPRGSRQTFQAAAQVERWAMPTWCHMFNSTLIGAARVWFDELPPESVYSYKDLKAAFLAYFMQQKKYVKDPVKIHNIKQKDGETIKDFMEQFKVETERMKGAPECMRIFGFMHGVNNSELTKRLNEHVPKTMEEMMITTTAFIRGEATTASKKKAEAGKFQSPPPMVTPVKKRSSNKLCDFYNNKGHNTDGCMQLKKQIEELVRAGKLLHLIKEIKHTRDQSKAGKKETPAKDKPATIYMIQSLQRMTRQKVVESFKRVREITFPPLTTSSGADGPLVIEAEIGGYMIHRMYVDGGSSMKILYEHCFNRLWHEVRNQMVPATTSLTGFSGETIWPLGQLRLLVTIGDADHSTRAWMNFMIVRPLSPYNDIIGRPGIKEIQAVPSTAHEMLKFPVDGGIVTIRSTVLIPAECATVITSFAVPKEVGARPENFKVALHLDFPDQEVAIGGTHDMSIAISSRTSTQYPGGIFTYSAKENRIVTLFQKSTGKWNFSAATLSSVFWTLTKAITRYSWQSRMKKKRLFTLAKGCIATQKCLSASRMLAPREHNITYRPRTSVTGQVLADILAEMSDECLPATSVVETQQEPWTLFTDRSSCVDGSGDGLILSPEGTKFTYALRFQFAASNNEDEYEALIAGLRIAAQMGVQNVHVSVDSKLIANQVLKTCVTKEENMIKYLEKVKSLVLVEILKEKSIQENEVKTMVEEDGPTWMTPIMEYLKEGTLPSDRKEARKLRIKARLYELLEGVLYRRSFLTSWLRCVEPLQKEYVIREIYEGSCSMYAEPRSVVAKAIWLGYYWPMMHRDARDMIRKVKFLIVAMDYFTKWIEAKVVATITGSQVKKFVWDNIVYCFGLPGEIVSDNDKQFNDNPFKDWCDKLNITQRFASVKHPQSNGLVERANRSLGEEIKACLGKRNKNCVEELPHVLWAHRTMIKSSHGDTPFSLTYGTKMVIPEEIGVPTYRTTKVDVVYNDEEIWLNLDLLEERRERAAIYEAKAKLKMTRYYNARVHSVTFRPGDFVYRSNDTKHVVDGGKLGPKWEGPYEVTEVLGDRAYKLRSTDGTVLPRT